MLRSCSDAGRNSSSLRSFYYGYHSQFRYFVPRRGGGKLSMTSSRTGVQLYTTVHSPTIACHSDTAWLLAGKEESTFAPIILLRLSFTIQMLRSRRGGKLSMTGRGCFVQLYTTVQSCTTACHSDTAWLLAGKEESTFAPIILLRLSFTIQMLRSRRGGGKLSMTSSGYFVQLYTTVQSCTTACHSDEAWLLAGKEESIFAPVILIRVSFTIQMLPSRQ